MFSFLPALPSYCYPVLMFFAAEYGQGQADDRAEQLRYFQAQQAVITKQTLPTPADIKGVIAAAPWWCNTTDSAVAAIYEKHLLPTLTAAQHDSAYQVRVNQEIEIAQTNTKLEPWKKSTLLEQCNKAVTADLRAYHNAQYAAQSARNKRK